MDTVIINRKVTAMPETPAPLILIPFPYPLSLSTAVLMGVELFELFVADELRVPLLAVTV